MFWQIAIWWLIAQALGLLALPLTTFLLRRLPDHGYAFSKSLGLLLTGYGAWLLAMFGLASFGAPLLIVVALLVGVAGMLTWRAERAHGAVSLRAPPWTTVLAYEAIFLLALVFVAWMRSYNPAPWGTERPMDFAFFNAIQNSAAFPPNDPWLAGFSINYYYFGYLLMAVMALLSGLEPSVAYNLALALIFALTALGVSGIIVNLIAIARARDDRPQKRVGVGVWAGALLGVILVLFAGNQSGVLQIIVGNERVVALDGLQLGSALVQAINGADAIELPSSVITTDFGAFTTLERSDKLRDFNWWWPSRALWDEYPDGMRSYNIVEFPFFSFWLGDMHPHVMALPFGLLALALALATLNRAALPAFSVGWRGWLELALTGIVIGSLYVINSWDLPTYMLLWLGALLLLYIRLARQKPEAPAWSDLLTQAVLGVIAIFVLFAPFYLTFRSLVGAQAPLIDWPVIGRLSQLIALFTAGRSGLHAFVIIFGLFALPLTAYVYLGGQRTGVTPPSRLQTALLWLPLLLLIVGLLIQFPLLALLGLGLLAANRALREAEDPARSFSLLVTALGCAILVGVELIFIRDVFGNRMNTVFKFYYQIWLLWGTLAPFALWRLLAREGAAQRAVAAITMAGVVVLLVGALVYPAVNLYTLDSAGQSSGLNGRTPRENSPDEAAAINWLRANAAPGSVVLEMIGPGGGSYNGAGFAGVSASTGLPTVLGWAGHEQQWRGGDAAARAEIDPRQRDVELIYSTTDPLQARDLLGEYDVDYIYVGELERAHYALESLSKFEHIATPAFQSGAVIVYKFLP